MFKKVILMSVLGIFITTEKIKSNDNAKAAIIVGVGVLGTAVYWIKRENNDDLIERAKLFIKDNMKICVQAETYISQNSCSVSSELNLLQNTLSALQVELLESKNKLNLINKTISGRYDSYVTPWNWSNLMLQISKDIKTALEMNNVVNVNIQLLLGKVNYLYCLKAYNNVLESIQYFIDQNKTISQKKNSLQNISSLEELLESKEAIRLEQIELEQFFAKYKQLELQLQQIMHSLNTKDRNQVLENSFNSFCLQAESLHSILTQHTKFLNTYVNYKECIANSNNEQFLIKEARKFIGGSSYPIKDFINQLNSDMLYLKNILVQETIYRQTILAMLQKIKDNLITSSEYVLELQAYELYLQQKRQSEAIEKKAEAAKRQARAAQEAAEAAKRQARALEEQNNLQREQNRLKEEQNRIERERNDIERRNQQNNNR